ncbi:MAG: tetratricopeptide repeat protein [Planctomycetota bacterium]|jgi:Tfp pilus assembly protein PilF
MTGWKLTGFVATIAIILSLPLYHFRTSTLRPSSEADRPLKTAAFVGTKACEGCHQKEYDLWNGSHHERAMDVANDQSMLGDFNDSRVVFHGIVSRFYKRDGKFFVHTQGPGGEMGEFEITHTFGWYPLQQYLIPFPGGRLQCLPIAWNSRENEWFHLWPDEAFDPGDWLYWTNAAQNWNGMCAECHSTNLRKNYDPDTDSYDTTWKDINVGCEACHGPGSLHVEWAELPDMARPDVDNYHLKVKTSALDSRAHVELCAPCHSRRAALGDYTHAEPDLLDSLLPQLLTEDLYFSDGQILEEVYVYGSFTQSKMYHRDVRCSDCHDVHSIETVEKGNSLCLQCHLAEEYDTPEHHFHKNKGEEGEPILSADGEVLFEVGTGAECVQCHMPGRYYMVVDYRPDHSFRIPRPDLTAKLGVPNACNRCHVDQTAMWADDYITQWYGPGRRAHYGVTLEAGQVALPEARKDLIHLAGDTLYPVIVRATALELLSIHPGEDTFRAFELALMDEESQIRRTAVERMPPIPDEMKIRLFAPMLYDPVKGVRIEAARQLVGPPSERLESDIKQLHQTVLDEYVAAMEYSADFSFGRHNLGNLYDALGQREKAIQQYKAAIKIDSLSYPAMVNLAMIYNQLGNNEEARKLLIRVLELEPDLHETAYSLGLLLAEMNELEEAAVYLKRAAVGMPSYPRVHYNLGLLQQQLGRDAQAEDAMLKALELMPTNLEFLYALTDFYMKRGRKQEAKDMAEKMVKHHPDQPVGRQMLQVIEQMN